MTVNADKLKKLLQAYLDLPAGAQYQTAMAGFQAAAQNYNAMQMKINYLWAGIQQSMKDRAALQAQIDAVEVRLCYGCGGSPSCNWAVDVVTARPGPSAAPVRLTLTRAAPNTTCHRATWRPTTTQ